MDNNLEIFKKLNDNLQKEDEIIPEKERVGKGSIYISRYVAREIIQFLIKEIKVDKKYLIKFTQKAFIYGENIKSSILQHFALLFLSEYIAQFPEEFENIIALIEKWANHEDWIIRECAKFSIISGLKKEPEITLDFLSKWAKSENKNIRRLVAEGLRPQAEVKWLRDAAKNDKVLEILTILNKDPSIYVRKSVGNNIKDLSKYMPEKMLNLMENWLKESKNIKVHDELASEIDLTKEEKRLIWTMKQAMRWIKERNPRFHSRLEKILGKNYVLYFDEKRNRLAKPLRKD